MNAVPLPTQIGKYRVRSLLGSGGMGRVYLAVDPDIGREVAIKRVTLGSDPQARERFLREAQTMGRLNHPNIVTLLEFGVDEETPFLVLEFLSGEDLSQWMHRPHRLREQVQVMLDVAQAIQAAHRVGVLHRDLKPENVRVLEDGRCKLLDFGIAESGAGQLTASGYFVGTPEYVAPEVMSGSVHTPAADIYALGLLYYTMLAGDNPFRGDTVQATVARVVQRDPPLLSTRVRGVPDGLVRLIHSCLAKQPESRPPDAAALVQLLAEELAQIGADAQIAALPPSADTAPHQSTPAPALTRSAAQATATAPAHRQRWLLPGALALLALIGSLWWLSRPLSEPAATSSPTAATPEPAPAGDSVRPSTATAPPATAASTSAPAGDSKITAAPPPAPPPPPAAAEPAKPVATAQRPPPASVTRAVPAPVRPDEAVRDQPSVSPASSAAADATGTAATGPAESPTAIAVPQAPPPSVALAPTPAVAAAIVQIAEVAPRVLHASRSSTIRIKGRGLAAVSAATMTSVGVVDPRFQVRALRHDGDTALELSLKVAPGVPLGHYGLQLQGDGVRAESIDMEVSL